MSDIGFKVGVSLLNEVLKVWFDKVDHMASHPLVDMQELEDIEKDLQMLRDKYELRERTQSREQRRD